MTKCYCYVQLAELDAKGKVLPASSGEYKVIQKIAERVIKAVQQGRGGGFQDHVRKCAPTNQPDNVWCRGWVRLYGCLL